MEPIMGAFFDEEWESLSKLFSTELHGDHDLFPMSDHHEANNNNFHYFSQESSITSCVSDGMFLPNNPSNEHLQHYSNNMDIDVNNFLQVAINNHPDDQSIDFFVMDNKNLENLSVNLDDTRHMATEEEVVCDHQLNNAAISPVASKEMQLKRKFQKVSLHSSSKEPENPKKKSRGSQDAQKGKKKAQPKGKKNQKIIAQLNNEEGEEETTNNEANQNGQSSSCCSSEDDSNASQELNGGAISSNSKGSALNLSGKSRASRGAATDPQSLYARKRRERINERLRILQNLVPNGTKVDISTMLEEAVNYVKFLQLQIKLLSSDEHWMYAPLAYHGMDIGLYQRMLPSL